MQNLLRPSKAASMFAFRRHLLRHRTLVAAFMLWALALKALVPAGMMLSVSNDMLLTVTICSGIDDARTVTIPIEGGQMPGEQDPHTSSADTMVCVFSALSQAMLGGADAVQLGLALIFILAAGLTRQLAVPARLASYRWPPMRGPPASA
jgi:hypothetical protein